MVSGATGLFFYANQKQSKTDRKINYLVYRIIYKIPPVSMVSKTNWSVSFLKYSLLFKSIIVFIFFFYAIYVHFDDYVLSETLLNYKFGFQRRSLIGSVFLFITENKTFLLVLITLSYSFCIASLFYLIASNIKEHTFKVVSFVLLIITCCPFGISFYLFSLHNIRKELFFFPIIALIIMAFKWKNDILKLIVINALIFTGYLIHESFLFLVFPFIISFCHLNKLKKKFISSYVLSMMTAVVIVYKYSVVPGPVVDNSVLLFKRIGFKITPLFMDPLLYLKMGFGAAVKNGWQFMVSTKIIIGYFIIYILNIYLIYKLFWLFRSYITTTNVSNLVYSIIFMHLAAAPLFLIGLDYGRWFVFLFIISFVLILNQIKISSVEFGEIIKLKEYKWIILTTAFFCIFRIPHFLFAEFGDLLRYLNFTIISLILKLKN